MTCLNTFRTPEGMTRRQAAAWRRVSPSTVQYWIDHYRNAIDATQPTSSTSRSPGSS